MRVDKSSNDLWFVMKYCYSMLQVVLVVTVELLPKNQYLKRQLLEMFFLSFCD